MTIRKIGSTYIFCLLVGLSFAQSADSLQLISSIETTAEQLYADPLGSFYLVDKKRSITKYASNGKLLFRYSNNRLGNLGWMDATDPFHIQLYFPEYRKLVLLDNDLSELETYDLLSLGLYDHPGIGLSYDNNFWIYDNNSGHIKKINKRGEVLLESDNLFYQLSEEAQPGRVVETKKYVLLLDRRQGVFVFDQFGKYLKNIKKVIPDHFQIWQGQISYFENGKLHFINIQDNNSLEWSLPSSEHTTQAQFSGGSLFTLNQSKLNIYKIKRIAAVDSN